MKYNNRVFLSAACHLAEVSHRQLQRAAAKTEESHCLLVKDDQMETLKQGRWVHISEVSSVPCLAIILPVQQACT